MVFKIRDADPGVDPPIYNPNSTYMSVSLHYGGTAIHVPVPKYIGGHVLLVDYVDAQNVTLQEVNTMCSYIAGMSEERRFYIEAYEGGGFKLLMADGELVTQAMLFAGGCIALPLYVDAVYVDPSQVEDNFEEHVENVVRAVESSFDNAYEGDFETTDDEYDFTEFVDSDVQENLQQLLNEANAGTPNLGSFFVDAEDANRREYVPIVDDDVELSDDSTEKATADEMEEDSDFMIENEREPVDDDRIYINNIDSDVTDELSDEENLEDFAHEVVGSDVELDENATSDEEANIPQFIMFDLKDIFNPIFNIGLTFICRSDFMKAVNSHTIMSRRNLFFSRNDPERVYARCKAEDCDWRINLVRRIRESGYFIREYLPQHSCPPTPEVKNLTSTWLSERYLYKFKADSKRSAEGFRQEVIAELRVNVSKDQAYRAKRLALKALQGKPDEQYTKLWDYANELRKTNPGSTIILGTDNSTGENRFCRFYVCFKALKDGFKAGCRPIIGVDGCHLKGPHRGILLTAVGVDANNNIYPVAFAVVGQEKTETWTWFLTVLKRDLDIVHDEDFTIMSDKQKGLINAIAEVFPGSPNRFCVRHLLNNFTSAGFRDAAFRNTLWLAAKATTSGQSRAAMQKMNSLDEKAQDWFLDKPPEQWSWAYFSTNSKCDMLLNNCCESFNNSILLARDKPIITMLEWIREHLMKKLQEGRDTAKNWKGRICPKITQILNQHLGKLADCIPIKADDTHYQISTFDGGMYAVDLGNYSCTCRKWQLCGIPCKHALSAILKQKGNPEDYVDHCYTIDTYMRSYVPVILPISGQELWSQSLFLPPLPPNFGRGVGRPRVARRREPDEPNNHARRRPRGRQQVMALRRQTPTIHCSCCGEPGHNVRACPEKEVMQEINVQEERSRGKRPEVQLRRNLFGEGTSAQGIEGTISTLIEVEMHTDLERSTGQAPPQTPEIMPPIHNVEAPEPVQESHNNLNSHVPQHNYLLTAATTLPGPSMFEQMLMGQQTEAPRRNFMPRQGHVMHSRVNIRAPAPMSGCSFTTGPVRPTRPARVTMQHGGQRVVNLSDLIAPDSQPTQGGVNK